MSESFEPWITWQLRRGDITLEVQAHINSAENALADALALLDNSTAYAAQQPQQPPQPPPIRYQVQPANVNERRGRPLVSSTPHGAEPSPPPLCPVHHTPMSISRYGGFYCTSKMPDGTYCKEKAR